MAKRQASSRYRVVCYELSGENQQVVMDATGDGFIAAIGVIAAGRLRGELVSAGSEDLQAHLALRIASDERLAASSLAAEVGGTRPAGTSVFEARARFLSCVEP